MHYKFSRASERAGLQTFKNVAMTIAASMCLQDLEGTKNLFLVKSHEFKFHLVSLKKSSLVHL